MSILRPMLRQLVRGGVPLHVAERKVIEQARRERRELTAAERQRLAKQKWANEAGLADAREDALVARGERWLGWDVAPPADDRWLTDPSYGDEGYLALYRTPGRQRPSERLSERGDFRSLGLVSEHVPRRRTDDNG